MPLRKKNKRKKENVEPYVFVRIMGSQKQESRDVQVLA